MADHVRKQIRDFVTTTLTGLTTTGANVFPSRVYPVEDATLPALLIYTNNETAEPISISFPRTVAHEAELVVEGVARANSALDDTLDTIIKEVVTALTADITFGGLVKVTDPPSVEITLTGNSQQPTGNCRMVFPVRYMTLENAPTTAQ